DCDLEVLRGWLDVMDDDGGLTIALADGRDLLVYADRDGEGTVHIGRLLPPFGRITLVDGDLALDLGTRGEISRKGVLVSSYPLEPFAAPVAAGDDIPAVVAIDWKPLTPGHLIVIREGAVIAEAVPPAQGAAQQVPSLVSPAVQSRSALTRPTRAEVRRFSVLHRTVYRYAQQVERSQHVFRLTPIHDRLQSVLEHRLTVSVPGQTRDFEDVFGNRVRRLMVDTPWNEMQIEARALVELRDVDPLDYRPLRARSTIPLVWMPWQRQTLAPFLLPLELPESQLAELSDYAMSFVVRNDYDLLDTLIDINQTIFREYQYRQGSTTVFSTPFEAYVNRRGVCQDFANLYICLARLLGVPARYVCGYVHCGPTNPNQQQSEASHAWVQLYLPEVGWKGFDPTNGVLTQTEHVRVAVGRNYVDASPTSGTIYVGGGPETLEVQVRVEPAEPVAAG
ncbi:MAG TPA: transglutaminase N-terminal domain-containing protein, partial [Kofleriaceae bacterium]|nr:transglutaminase N-terminal domain-containing protein [Kofleriaceae bacterium]